MFIQLSDLIYNLEKKMLQAIQESVQKLRADDKINAKKQKEALLSLYNNKKRNITDFNANDQLFIISKEFIDLWRRFIR